jgi:hypothetical protein
MFCSFQMVGVSANTIVSKDTTLHLYSHRATSFECLPCRDIYKIWSTVFRVNGIGTLKTLTDYS